jgi:hypothetical protein
MAHSTAQQQQQRQQQKQEEQQKLWSVLQVQGRSKDDVALDFVACLVELSGQRRVAHASQCRGHLPQQLL